MFGQQQQQTKDLCKYFRIYIKYTTCASCRLTAEIVNKYLQSMYLLVKYEYIYRNDPMAKLFLPLSPLGLDWMLWMNVLLNVLFCKYRAGSSRYVNNVNISWGPNL